MMTKIGFTSTYCLTKADFDKDTHNMFKSENTDARVDTVQRTSKLYEVYFYVSCVRVTIVS